MNNRHLNEPIFFTPPPTKTDRRMWKGGKGGQAYYHNLENLYAEQTAMAQTMRGVAEGTVIPAYKGLMNDANEFDSIANRERAATLAGADARAASSNNMKMATDELASMGANPVDWDGSLRGMGVQGAAMEAGASTGARDRIEQQGWARRKDATGMGMDIPGDASSMMAQAAGGYSGLQNMRNQEQQQYSNNVAGAVQGGMNAYKIWKGADGGYVDRKKLRGIGPDGAKGYFMGGSVRPQRGFMSPGSAPPAPVSSPKPQGPGIGDTLTVGADAAKTGYDAYQGKPGMESAGKGIEWLGEKTGSQGMQQFGEGMRLGQAGLREKAAAEVTAKVNEVGGALGDLSGFGGSEAAVGDLSGFSAPIPGAETAVAGTEAATAAAGTEAIAGAAGAAEAATAAAAAAEAGTAATALSGGLGAAGAAVGTAVPVIGAGLALASLLGAFGADGGEVEGGDEPSIRPRGIGYARGAREAMSYAKGGDVAIKATLGSMGMSPNFEKEDGSTDWGSLALGPGLSQFRDRFAEGGTVAGRAPGFEGGDVEGPGGPEDDTVPAWLSDGEFVLNADAVRHFGLDRLHKMNNKGLEIRRGISPDKGKKNA
jgi:hypothetical protein